MKHLMGHRHGRIFGFSPDGISIVSGFAKGVLPLPQLATKAVFRIPSVGKIRMEMVAFLIR